MKYLFALLASCAVIPASAADLQPRKPVPAAIAGWSGLYFGIHGGENLGAFSPIFVTDETSTKVNFDDNSPFVGGHIGYLVQTTGGVIIGPEIGVQYWGFKKKNELPGTDGALLQTKIDWLAYMNMRIGISPFANAMIYITGGGAWAHIRGELVNVADLGNAVEQSVLGWNVGGGVEYKLSEYVILGAEYRHYDFGNQQGNAPDLLLGIANTKVDQAMVRASFRLDTR